MCGVVPHEAAVISRESPAASPSVALQPQAHVALFETPPDRKPPQKAGHLTRCCKLDQNWIPCPRPSVVLNGLPATLPGAARPQAKNHSSPFPAPSSTCRSRAKNFDCATIQAIPEL